MVQLELPHVNVLSKCDLVKDKSKLEQWVTRSPVGRALLLDAFAHRRPTLTTSSWSASFTRS